MENSTYLNQEEFERIFKRHLRISTYSMSIKTLFGDRLSEKIKYDPYYQRNYVWDKAKATFFIESILLGTDIPPLILFNSGGKLEVIDGRQRFETIKRFRSNDIALLLRGLSKLPQLKKSTFAKLEQGIKDIFEDAKIRIFEFEVINEPSLETRLEDKIKKEIFRRYNSGITPLNTSEIDNATYNEDDISNYYKILFTKDEKLLGEIIDCFLGPKITGSSSNISKVLQFIRKALVLTKFPISTYASGNNRTEILELYYNFLGDNIDSIEEFCEIFKWKLETILQLRNSFKEEYIKENKLIFECILWATNIVIQETSSKDFSFDENQIVSIENHYSKYFKLYSSDNSFYYRSIIDRFRNTAEFFSKLFNVDFDVYIKNLHFKDELKDLRQSEKEAKLKLEELESLRANKPDPSVVPIDEIVKELSTKRYLLRPSYQRQEKISIYKASAIIESIILGINLPPIFLCKNKNGIKEVIDGQQRLISILGFLGEQYLDEHNQLLHTNNTRYALKKLKILTELNGNRYDDLPKDMQGKILDFRLQIIEIDEKINPHFEPVDLFIRLNNKPFPIKENSFEMWNSFVEKDVIEVIRSITDANADWFFIKVRAKDKTRDRMQNEEMLTMLSYISYKKEYENSIGVYMRDEKLNCRIKEKKSISTLLEDLSVKELEKANFLKSIASVKMFIENLGRILNTTDKRSKLNELFGVSGRRSLVDFYMTYLMLSDVSADQLSKIQFLDLKNDLNGIQKLLRNEDKNVVNEAYLENFHNILRSIINKYKSL